MAMTKKKKLSRNVDDRVVTTYNGEEKDKMKAGSQFALSAASQSRSKHDHSETQKKKEEELDDNEVKYQRRLAQNRKTAQLRRNRGRMYLERLETEKKMLQDYHICLQEERRKLKHYHSVLLSMLNNSNQPGGGSALLHQQRGEGLSLSSAPQVLPQPPQIGGGIISPPQFGPLRSQQQKLLQQDSTRGLLLDSPDAFCQPRQKRHLQQANNLPHLPPFLPQQPPPASQQHLNNIIQQHKSNTHQRAAFMASALGGAGGLGSSGHVPSALVCAGHRNSTLSSNFLPRSLLVYENHLLQQSYKEQALGRSRQAGSPSTFSHLFNDSHNPNHGEIQQGHPYYHDHFQQQRTDEDIEKQLQHQGRMLSDHEMSSSPNMPPLNANLKQQEKREDK
mmetsp:Transcript_11995/g.18225  ORF Transcript_11995/g.18225 Transcript_11995/m.18225 type:complete len:391 (+) Transcript_11995:305-1477(+)